MERGDADLALDLVGDVSCSGAAAAVLPGQDPEALTRTLARLEEAGVLSLESRVREGWLVRRVGGWTRAAARGAVAAWIERGYRAVEIERRASLAELVELALAPDAGAALAARLVESAPLVKNSRTDDR